MVKDRTAEFRSKATKNGTLKQQDSNDGFPVRLEDAFPSESTEFLKADDWEDIEKFLDGVKRTQRKMDEMDNCLEKMRKIHDEILISPGVQSAKTDALNDNVEQFKTLSKSAATVVKGMNETVTKAGKDDDANYRIKKNQALALTRRLQNVLVDFNTEQVEYREKCRAKINKFLTIAGLHIPEDEVDAKIESGELYNTVGIYMAEREKKLLFEDVKSRHDDIVRLEKSIRELHELFQDMAMLVQSQGELVDRIEDNVTSAAEYTGKATANVHYAKEAQRRNIKLKIAIACCSVVTIILLFLFGSAVFCFYLPFICR